MRQTNTERHGRNEPDEVSFRFHHAVFSSGLALPRSNPLLRVGLVIACKSESMLTAHRERCNANPSAEFPAHSRLATSSMRAQFLHLRDPLGAPPRIAGTHNISRNSECCGALLGEILSDRAVGGDHPS